MDEIQNDPTNFWAVGSTLTGTRDHAKFFIKNRLWEDGPGRSGNPVNKPTLDLIKKGDYLLMTSSTTKSGANSRSVTKLKAIGKVIGRVKDNYYTFLVEWDNSDHADLPKEFNGIWYGKTIESVKVDEMLRYARKILRLTNKETEVNS